MTTATKHPFTLLDIVDKCDGYPYPDQQPLYSDVAAQFIDFKVDRIKIGQIHRDFLPELDNANFDNRLIFDITPSVITFMPWLDDFKSRTDAIATVLDHWRKNRIHLFPCLTGWRNELYGAFSGQGTSPEAVVAIERAACGLFGIHATGIHLNGYVKSEKVGATMLDAKLWIARRSLTKPTHPGKLDNMVAGGMEYGHSPAFTVIKEAMEEACLPKEIAERAKPAGTISYAKLSSKSGESQPETQIVYDLEVPTGVIPKPGDGEVQDFQLLTMDQVLDLIRAGDFKPNCAVVCLDFMIRHAVLTPENEPDYIEIIQRIHRRLEIPGPRHWF